MGNTIKKVSSIVLSTTTTIWLTGAMALMPVAANAQTVAELQAQISALLAQITALQATLATVSGGAPSAACSFTRNLTLGASGDDVKCLQTYLTGTGHFSFSGGSTGTFGPVTQAAVAKWQSANAVSPAAGYFGSLSRAKYTSMAAAAPVAPAVSGVPGGWSLAADSPTGSVIAGAGQVDVMKFHLTGPATVTELKFTKVGVVSDTLINNIYLADESGSVVAQYSSLSGGVATFSGLNWNVSAGVTRTWMLRVDLSSSATAGNTLAWKLGTLTSHIMTVTTVTNPAIATANFDFNTVGSNIDAGTTGVLVSNTTVNVTNSPVDLKSIKYTVVGSANMADLKNAKLSVNGVAQGSTVSQPASDGAVVFSFASAPVRLKTGNNTIDVKADVLGSPNRTMDWTVLRPYDVSLVDSQYNSGISPSFTDTTSGQITINKGQITVQLASDTPTGNIPVGVSSVTLAKFTIYAAGEPVKVKFLPVKLTASMNTTSTLSTDLRNLTIVDDVGGQLGNSISTPGTANCEDADWDAVTDDTVICDFGTSSSPINYIVPANTTRILSVKVDIQSASDLTKLKAELSSQTAALVTVANNLEGQISFQAATSGTSAGSALVVVSNPLTAAVNAAYTAPTLVAAQTNAKIGSYVFTASSAEGAKITTLTFVIPVGTDATADDIAGKIQNLKVMVGTTQFGTTRATVNAASNDDVSVQFSGSSPINVTAGGSVTVDLHADILSGSVDGGTAWSQLSAVTATGAVSNSTLTVGGLTATGQNVALATTRVLTIAQDSATPSAKQIVMNTTGNTLFKIRLTADNVEDIKITDLKFENVFTGSDVASLINLSLYDGSLLVGGPLPLTVNDNTSSVTFSFATPVVVTKNTSKTVEVKGDVSTFESGAQSGTDHLFRLATSSVTALGKDSNGTVTVTSTVANFATANTSTVARTKLTIASALLGAGSGRTRVAVDDIATMTFSANSAFQATVNSVSLKFTGLAVTGTFNVSLIDATTNAKWGATDASESCAATSNSCTVAFDPGPAFIVSAGTGQNVKVRVDSSNFNNAANSSDSMSVLVNAAGDVTWKDGTSNFNLEATIIPFTVVNVSFE